MQRILILILIFKCSIQVDAQPADALNERRQFPFFQVQYSAGIGLNDLASPRYGLVNNLGPGFGFKFKNNVSIAVETNFTFGNMQRNNDLFPFVTPDSFLITREGNLDDPIPFLRGVDVRFNTIIPIYSFKNTPNTSIAVQPSVGWGYYYVHYRVEDPRNVVLLEDQYRKGIDKLRSGFQYQVMLLYDWHSNNNLRNFRLGFFYTSRFSKNQRSYSFDNYPVKEEYKDDQIGVRIDWNLPFVSSKVTSKGIVY